MDMEAFRTAISAGKIGKTHKGSPHSDETKALLSQKAKERLSIPENNPMFGKKRSAESREKQSKTRSQRFVDGIYDWKMWTQSGHVISEKAGKIFCRSSWEKKLVKMLDEDASVSTFKTEPISIPYYKQEAERQNLRYYVPDFLVSYVDGRKVLLEVKPECHVNAAVNIAKFAAARELCQKNGWEFRVLTQKELCI